ncbi:MAG: calcium-binding protein, partial [Solirubrobacterales bacterium]
MPWPRLIAGIVGLSVLLALPAAPAAKPRNSPTPPMDTATATGDNLILDDYGSVEIEVDAHSGPSGENPGGHVSFVAGQILPISGPVTCLNVSGNTALMTVSPTGSFVDFALVRVVDNGGSGLDRFEYIWAPPPLQISSNCHVDLPPLFGGPLIGRAVVNDRQSPPPVPTCMGKEVTITLNSNGQPIGAANDNVEGTDGDDVINTGSGDDLVDAASGNDLICTGDGVDRVLDGGGNDRIEAGPGRDRLSLGGGDDVADAGNGNNLILDGEGDDTYVAGSGDDKVVDGRGDDRVKTGPGEDTVRGDSGENTFRLGAGNDAAVGGIGNEVILGGTGVDYLLGSRGDDTLRGG